jgi:predicted dehydrogenase
MEKTKVAIVGVGNISEYHIEGYLKSGRAELCAFCDINEKQLAYMGEKYGVTNLYTDEEEMFKEHPEIEAVSVCTWNSAHAPCAIAALNAGKHVICEKPMAMNAEEARAMQEAAEKNGKLLMIGFVRRFGDDCFTVENLIDGDRLGEIYYAKASYLRRNGAPGGWFGDKLRSGGGPLIDLGVHVIDLARFLMGKPNAVSVYGSTFSKLGNRPEIRSKKDHVSAGAGGDEIFNCEDLATALIRFDNGAVLFIDASFSVNTGAGENSVQLFGTNGGVKIANEVSYFGSMDGYLTNVSFDYPTGLDFQQIFHNEIAHFLGCVRGEIAECRNPAEDGVALMEILDAIYKSAECGHEITL